VTITMKTGVKKDGTMVARQCNAVLDGGAYCSLGPLTTVLVGTFQTLPYRIPNYQYDGYRIYTNKPPCGAMRGHGGPQAHFAQDVQLDMIAEALGIDPAEMALKNGLRTGERSAAGFNIISSGFTECVQKVADETKLKEKRSSKKADRGKAYGIGLGCGGFPSGAGFYFTKHHIRTFLRHPQSRGGRRRERAHRRFRHRSGIGQHHLPDRGRGARFGP